jgi:2-oxo-4-hydroxy-4-carboxy-5-ureidoimidazoline decarboxylase
MTVAEFNDLPADAAINELTRCCGASKWAQRMAGERPYADLSGVLQAAREIWDSLGAEDWREAFQHHPKIGDVDSLKKKFAATAKWAIGEQSGAADAGGPVLQALADRNTEYENKFGFIFIVCATGKSAGEMLHILNERIENDAERELQIAAAEQGKITLLRLEKLLS